MGFRRGQEGEGDTGARRLGTALALLVLAAVVGVSAWLRTPGFTQGGFASHDVAGMLYNAMVLDAGGLPYVDTLELKAPGSFWLARWFAGPESRDIARFQIVANLWALASLVAVAAAAWRLWGRLGSVAAAGLYALHDVHLDSMDANYVTWANLPQILSFWAGIEAWRSTSARWRPTLWLLAGAAAGAAALCKRPAGVVLVVVLAMAACPTREGVGGEDGGGEDGGGEDGGGEDGGGEGKRRWSWRDPLWVLGGFALAHAPIAAVYAGKGELGAFVEGYGLSRWGLRYVGERAASVPLGGQLREGAFALAHFLPLPVALASFAGAWAVVVLVRARRGAGGELEEGAACCLWLCLWALASVAAASVGLRFYKGYFLACAAPFSMAAAAPWGLLGARFRGHWAPRLVVGCLASTLIVRSALMIDAQRLERVQPHDLGGRRIADFVTAHSEPEDQIWVWGWHLWDVYPLTGQLSGSRIYKSLGVLSQPNDDTWRRGARPLRFVDSAYAEELIEDLEASRPRYVVLGSTVPHRDFEALQRLLRAEYHRDRRAPRIGRVQFWRLRD